ncbi:MAG: ABC transporter ATP-binding protein [Lachnospiraceae bacterium]|nr:ABC transporter ATP-binding protein [Lachnospiraceae bacterium]
MNTKSEPAITISGITMTFGEKQVLNHIDLSIRQGEIFGLLGPSGAGKTTLIKILTGQQKADAGYSAINGICSDQLKGSDYRQFGIMMDNFGVYERFSCFDNLKIFAKIYHIGNEEIYKTLEQVGLKDAAKTPASRLSKGMKSRLRLARVFLINPSVLFLDEPTSGLDPATAEEIQNLIFNERRKGKTIFLTTHNMTEAAKLCDHVALLHEGSIVEYGEPEEICRRYNHQKRLKLHLMNGTDVELPHTNETGLRLAEYFSKGLVETIHSTEPNLETVFMELTGKGLS